jgi:antitoxin (DNA-binding transcriptional repressor) of toxin-antitoxin stability system
MPNTVNIHAAKTHFSRLVEQASRGEEIIIARRIAIGANFNAPLPDELLRQFEGP